MFAARIVTRDLGSGLWVWKAGCCAVRAVSHEEFDLWIEGILGERILRSLRCTRVVTVNQECQSVRGPW